MMWLDYYLYLYNLEEYQRIKEVMVIVAILITLLIIAFSVDYFKEYHLDKIKNKRIRNFIKKL